MSAIFGGSFYLKSSLGPVSESNSARMAVDLVLLSEGGRHCQLMWFYQDTSVVII